MKDAQTPGSTSSLPDYTDAEAEALFGYPSPPPPSVGRLALPIALPQTSSSYDAAFVRAYHEDWKYNGVEMVDWLRFVDGLNLCLVASPPLRIVDMTGLVLGFVPYHWALIAGIVMQTAAQTAAHILSKSLTDKYLVRANTTYFEPRGLKVRLMKTAAMRKFVGIDEDDGKGPGKAKAFAKAAGRTAENVVLRLPLPRLGRLIEAIHRDPVPVVDPNTSDDVSSRRLAQLRGYIHPVTTHVPPPIPPSSLYDKSSALAMKMDAWRRGLFETNAMRNRHLLAVAEGRAQPGSRMQPYATGSGKIVDTLGNAWNARQEAKVRWSRRSARKLNAKVKKLDRIEMNQTDGLVWLVVLDLDQDRIIQGRELADSTADEVIENDEWQEEVDCENEDEEYTAFEMKKLK